MTDTDTKTDTTETTTEAPVPAVAEESLNIVLVVEATDDKPVRYEGRIMVGGETVCRTPEAVGTREAARANALALFASAWRECLRRLGASR